MRHAGLGFAFGLAVMVCGMASAGAGHGSYLPLAIGAAPFSLIPFWGFFAAPVWWGAIGFLADRRWPLAVLALLVVHTIAAMAILWLGSPIEPGAELWRYFWQAMRAMPVIVGASIVVYTAGLGLAWAWTLDVLMSWVDG